MPLQGREEQTAKSLDCNLGNVHTCPHFHYLIRQCDGVDGWVRQKYRRRRCRSKINNLMKKEPGNSIFFVLYSLLGSPDPFSLGSSALLTLMRLPHPLGLFLLPCSSQTSASRKSPWCFSEIAGYLVPSSASGIASDVHSLPNYNLIVKYLPPV